MGHILDLGILTILFYRTGPGGEAPSRVRVTNQSHIGRCAVCGGFLALPDYVTFLAFFWPDELEPHQVTGRIKDVWKQQKINVCFIHALTDGVRIPERMISLSLNTNPPS